MVGIFLREKLRASGQLRIDARAVNPEVVDRRDLRPRADRRADKRLRRAVGSMPESFSSGALSRSVTFAPSSASRMRSRFAASARAEDGDVFVFVIAISSQLQSGQPEERKDDRKNPKPDDHGVFLPAAQLEMMMNRRHGEKPFAGELETEDLEDDGEGFEDENAAHDGEEQLLFTTNRNHADGSADRE